MVPFFTLGVTRPQKMISKQEELPSSESYSIVVIFPYSVLYTDSGLSVPGEHPGAPAQSPHAYSLEKTSLVT